MSTITRHFISDNFRATNLVEKYNFTRSEYGKTELVDKINLWKYALTYKCNAKSQETILIGSHTLDINYLACIYASAELGLKIAVVDYIRADDFKDSGYNDPKTEALLPIDIF